jgi:hypothetical protein
VLANRACVRLPGGVIMIDQQSALEVANFLATITVEIMEDAIA